MSVGGIAANGVIVLDNTVQLPEGTGVEVHVAEAPTPASPLAEMLLRHAGKAEGLPADAAAQNDRYLYGTPKR